jgi:putative RecB family exonuclease
VSEHRSVSQLKLYERCPMAYKLSRLDKVWSRPAAWLAQGSAVHEAAEAYERSGRTMTLEQAQDVFRESYVTHIEAACEVTPNFEVWFKSGPYGGEVDIERRYQIGLEQVQKYLNWYESHPDEVIWVSPDGTPGIELGFDIDLDGVPVRGFIDAVIWDGETLIVRDNKTGNTPGDDFQLAVYAVALAEQFGIERPKVGDYWMGKAGKPTYPYGLEEWSREAVTEKFKELEDNIQAGKFDADPEPSKCRFCDVSWACDFAV